ncbi:MAG TPA: methyltransferase domain-containing protein, partial [Candidatus Melainabacteria bacterium]|nr:methyltransferase domain-containing protein [Candidatus Melainabacteria bacterium]
LILTKQRLPEMNLFQMDARHIPFRDEFDLIGAFDVLEHIEEDEEVLVQLRKAVKENGGGLILTVPQHRFLWSKLDEYSCHFRRYEKEQLIELVTGAGFEVLHSTSFVSLLMPIMLVSRRLMSQKGEKDFDPLSELRINKSLNYLLETVMRLEQISIKAGVSYGTGGSLLLLARAK